MAKADKITSQGKALRDEGGKWIARIAAATRLEKEWMDDAEKAVKAFSGEMSAADAGTASTLGNTYDFNILFANVETIVPAVINSPPAPDIRRRFQDEDPAGKDVAELIERAIRIQVDDGKLQVELEGQAQDAFLAGRGVVRLRFNSDFVKDAKDELGDATDAAEQPNVDDGSGKDDAYAGSVRSQLRGDGSAAPAAGDAASPQERLANERITFEAVSWRDYRHGPAKRWSDRPWDAFRFVIPREDESAVFDAGLISSQTNDEERKARGEADSDLTGWEVWCKRSKKVYFVDDDGIILKTVDDPLGLTNFFCISTPVQPVELTGRLKPVTPFAIYKRLADELDLTTKRINIITNHMKVKGWYPGDAGDIANMLTAEDAEFVPIKDVEIWAANGGLAGAVAWWPVEKFVVVLKELYAAREQTKQAIYEITGISDIVRGASQASETATAQNIKTQWGSLRIQKMQRMMERGARDLFVMMSEIIPTKFSAETLQEMTGVQLIPTQQDLTPVRPPPGPPPGAQVTPEQQQQLQQATQAAQQAEQQRQAKLAKLQSIQQLLSKRLATTYRIDVESDSTVKADLSQQKQETAEFMQAAGAYWAAVGPLVMQGALSKDVAVEIFAANSRLFNLGKSVEDTLEKMLKDAKEAANQPPQPSPEQQKAQADAKAQEQDMQAKAADAKIKMAAAEQSMTFEREKHAMTMQQMQMDMQAKKSAARDQRNQALIEKGITPPPDPEVVQGLDLVKEMQAQREQFGQFLTAVVQALNAPKRVVKDQAGRPVGIEPVQLQGSPNGNYQ